jgi:hypothetical protein
VLLFDNVVKKLSTKAQFGYKVEILVVTEKLKHLEDVRVIHASQNLDLV